MDTEEYNFSTAFASLCWPYSKNSQKLSANKIAWLSIMELCDFFFIGFYCKLKNTVVKYVEPDCLYLLIESVWHRLSSVIPQWSSYPGVLQFYSKRMPWDKKLLYSADHLLNLPVRFLLMLTTRISINVIYCGKRIMQSVPLCNETIKERTTISDGNNFWLLLAWG